MQHAVVAESDPVTGALLPALLSEVEQIFFEDYTCYAVVDFIHHHSTNRRLCCHLQQMSSVLPGLLLITFLSISLSSC